MEMKERVSQYFYMSAQIYKKCASCIVYASVKGQGFRGKSPLVKIPGGGVFEYIGKEFVELDFIISML